MSQEHRTDFAGFNISYDNYHSTHSERTASCQNLSTRLKENGFIKNRTISQLYDPEKGMFLPDRFVKGTCPKCKSRINTAITAKSAARPTARLN